MTELAIHRPALAVYFADILVRRASEKGLDRRRLLARANINPGMLADPRARLSPAQLGQLMRDIWVELDDELLGFSEAPHRFGSFALMARQMVACDTLGEALRYSLRFQNLTSGAIRWELVTYRGQARLSLRLVHPATDTCHFLEEFFPLVWHRFANWLIGERVPLIRTEFSFPQPQHSAEHHLMFPGPILYGRPDSALLFDAGWLHQPVMRSRLDLRRYLQRLPDEWFVRQDFEQGLGQQILEQMRESERLPSLQQLAGQLRVSGRTLARQLQREGSSYRAIRDQHRREVAMSMLKENRYQIREIARRLDMTEPGFSRAFRHWTGSSPLAWRKAQY
jgi:AraC-like DNA-binding protein